MLSFFAKILLLIAAAFGFGTLVGRRARPARTGKPQTAKAGASSDTLPEMSSQAPAGSATAVPSDEPSVTGPSAITSSATGLSVSAPDVAGKGAAEPAKPAVVDDPLREKHKAEPFQKNFRSVDYSRLSLDQAAIEAEREKRRRSSWVGPMAHHSRLGQGGAGQLGAGLNQAEPDGTNAAGRFAGFGGATVTADVIRGKSDERVPTLMPTLPGDDPNAPTQPAAPKSTTGSNRPPSSAPLRRPGLGDPHPDGPTPAREARSRTPPDPLAEKHKAEPFDRDFRTVDYSRLRAAPAAAATTDPAGAVVPVAKDMGQRSETDETDVVSDDAYPAAFRVLGVSGPVQGAAAGGGSGGDDEADRADRWAAASDETTAEPENAGPGQPARLGAPGTQEGAMGMEPERLSAPRDDKPDDLTRIKGIGPAIERILFEHGIFHFDQIAGWGAAEARWIEQMIGFAGRVERERWIAQAETFSRKTG